MSTEESEEVKKDQVDAELAAMFSLPKKPKKSKVRTFISFS